MTAFFIRCLKGWWQNENWGARETVYARSILIAFACQIFFGLSLWLVFSPIVHAFFMQANLIADPTIRFWSFRHPAEMLFAFVFFFVVNIFARKSKNSFRFYGICTGVVLILILAAIPWPWLTIGRPLLRF
jgi:hypothetical protein